MRTPHLLDAWAPGLQRLRARDRDRVEVKDTRRLGGSVFLDEALRPVYPGAYPWDYGVGYRPRDSRPEHVYWVEVHEGTDREVAIVLQKLCWLKGWLASDGQSLNRFERDFVWVSTGRTSFTATAPQSKRLAEKGLRHVGRRLRVGG